MTQLQLIQRIEELEREMREVRSTLESRGPNRKAASYRDFIGMFHGDPDFKKAMEFGARYRRSQRPKPLKKRVKK